MNEIKFKMVLEFLEIYQNLQEDLVKMYTPALH